MARLFRCFHLCGYDSDTAANFPKSFGSFNKTQFHCSFLSVRGRDNMKIEDIKGGFVQYFDNKLIEKITWVGEYIKVGTYTVLGNGGKLIEVDKYKFEGTCTIHFHGKPAKEFSNDIIDFCTVYNSQYGIPISNDGKKLFVGSTYKVEDGVRKGLRAYDTETGEMIWRLNEGNIANIFVYDNYIVFLKAYASVFKVDINNGDILGQVKGSTVEQIFDLGNPYVLADAPVGNLKVIDTEKMLVVKKYTPKITNPLKCGSFRLGGAKLRDNSLTIFGYEYPPNATKNTDNMFGWPFERIIDTAFHSS